MKDWLEAFKDHINERLSNPWIGSYSFSWIIINYKFFIIVFSKLPPLDKIAYIQGNLYGDPFGLIHYFLTPLLMAFLYIFILPHPARWALEYTLGQNKKSRELRQRVEEETLLSQVEAKQLRASVSDTVKKLEDEIEQLTRRGEIHKASTESLQAEIRELREKLSHSTIEYKLLSDNTQSLKQQNELLGPIAASQTSLLDSIDRNEVLAKSTAKILGSAINSPFGFNSLNNEELEQLRNFNAEVEHGRFNGKSMIMESTQKLASKKGKLLNRDNPDEN